MPPAYSLSRIGTQCTMQIILAVKLLAMEAAYPFSLPSCNCTYFPSKNNIKGMMDYDWLPWIFMEGVIMRVACLNVKRIEHQGEQKSCLKTSSHCKKRNKVSCVRCLRTTLWTPWRHGYSSDISPGSEVNNRKHRIKVTYPQKKRIIKLNTNDTQKPVEHSTNVTKGVRVFSNSN